MAVAIPALRRGRRYQSGRYFGDDRRNLFGLREVKWSVEPGAFVEAWPVEWLRARALEKARAHIPCCAPPQEA